MQSEYRSDCSLSNEVVLKVKVISEIYYLRQRVPESQETFLKRTRKEEATESIHKFDD